MKAKIVKAIHAYAAKHNDRPIPLKGDECLTVFVKWGYCPDDSEELKAEMGDGETVTLQSFGYDESINCITVFDTNGIEHYLSYDYFSRAEKKRVMDVLSKAVARLQHFTTNHV